MNRITLWMTGLSASGKSTMAAKFVEVHPDFVLLDGDMVRKGLCSDLGFSREDRAENMRRLIELCILFNGNGKDVVTAFISPFEEWRRRAKERIGDCRIVYCKADLKTCERRDPKGLYRKARAGKIPEFTGIDSPYEVPWVPDLVLDTQGKTVHESLSDLLRYVKREMK